MGSKNDSQTEPGSQERARVKIILSDHEKGIDTSISAWSNHLTPIKARGYSPMKKNQTLTGRVANQVATEAAKRTHASIPEIEMLSGTFRITVKDEEEKVLYENKEEPYDYYKLPAGSAGLLAGLKFYGATVNEDQTTFIIEALKSEETNKAVQTIVDVLNADLRESAKGSTYSKVLNAKTPVTDEQITNAHASQLRNYLRSHPEVTAEVALKKMHEFDIIPKSFTLADYNSNKGKR